MGSVDCSGERDDAEIGTGAPCLGAPSPDEAGSSSYYLRLFHNGPYDVGYSEEVRHRWLAGERTDWAEGYVKGNFEIVLRFCIDGSREVADLVFFAVPHMRVDRAAGWQLLRPNIGVGALKSNAGQKAVLAAVAEFVENPDGTSSPIASLVRLERPKERQDVRWQVFTAASAYHVRFELRGGVGDREIAGFGFPFSAKDRSFVSKVVEGRPEVFDNLDNPKVEDCWDVFYQPAFVSFCQAIRTQARRERYKGDFPKRLSLRF